MDIQQELVHRGAQEVVFLRLEFDCAIGDLKGRRFELVIEQPQPYEMWYNGMRTPLTDGGAFWDTPSAAWTSRPSCGGAQRDRTETPVVHRRAEAGPPHGSAAGWEARLLRRT